MSHVSWDADSKSEHDQGFRYPDSGLRVPSLISFCQEHGTFFNGILEVWGGKKIFFFYPYKTQLATGRLIREKQAEKF